MSVVDRYIAKNFLGAYFLLLLAALGTIVFFDVIVNLDEFTEQTDLSTMEVLRNMGSYYAYQIPNYFALLGGALMSIAACFTYAMMLRNNELTALIAAGMSLQRLVTPVLLVSIPLVAVWILNNELLIPEIGPEIARARADVAGTRTATVNFARDRRGAILRAAQFYPKQGRLNMACILEPDAEGQPAAVISADEAEYDAERGTWRFQRGTRISLVESAFDALGGTIQPTPISEYRFELDADQLLLTQSAQWTSLLSIRQMNALIAAHNLPNLPSVQKERDIRLTKPLLIWIMILLTCPFFLTRQPTKPMVAGGKALLIGGIFFITAFVCHVIPPDVMIGDIMFGRVVVAFPVIVFGSAALVLFANIKT